MGIQEVSAGALCPIEILAANGKVRFVTTDPSLLPQSKLKSLMATVSLGCGVSMQQTLALFLQGWWHEIPAVFL